MQKQLYRPDVFMLRKRQDFVEIRQIVQPLGAAFRPSLKHVSLHIRECSLMKNNRELRINRTLLRRR